MFRKGVKRMFKILRNDGKLITLLNPSEKAEKFADELKMNTHYTNDSKIKADKFGNASLTKAQRAYRSGYLDARKDSAKAYKAKNKKR